MKKVIITTGIVALAGGIATAITMSSCNDCELSDDPSVIVSFVPADTTKGDYLLTDHVEFEYTDATGQTVSKNAKCLARSEAGCEEWGIGQGKAGVYIVHAEVCGQEVEKRFQVELGDDGCRADAQLNTISLDVDPATCATSDLPEVDEPAPRPQLDWIPDWELVPECTLEARVSVLASTWAEIDGKMQPIQPDKVFYTWDGEPNGRELEGFCVDPDCYLFAAGFEKEGEFTVGAEICGERHTATATVRKDADGCHVMTQHARILGDVRNCEEREQDYTLVDGLQTPLVQADEPLATCLPNVTPSAYVIPVINRGDYLEPFPTEELVYIHDDERFKAHCALKSPSDEDRCLYWVTGYGKNGRFQAFTETCEGETSIRYSVPVADDDCNPKTQYIYVDVNTMGCVEAYVPGKEPELPQAQFVPDQAKYQTAPQCTLEARASVIASTWVEDNGRMIPIQPDSTKWTWDGEPNGRWYDGLCTDSTCTNFIAGFETEGEFTVKAEICGEEVQGEATVGMTDDGCHVDSQQVRLVGDIRDCQERVEEVTVIDGLETPLVPAGEPLSTCLPNSTASAYIIPVETKDDYLQPHPTEELVYYHDDERFKAHCALETDDGKCEYWVAGFGKNGRFEAFTETCDRETAIEYSVPLQDDQCLPQTQYLYVDVDTSGCISMHQPPSSPEGMGSVSDK